VAEAMGVKFLAQGNDSSRKPQPGIKLETLQLPGRLGLRLMCSKNPPISSTSQKKCQLFFFNSHTVPIILTLFFLPLAIAWIIAGDNTYILLSQNEAHHHLHNHNHNNLSYLFIKVHQNHLKKHSQNLAINNCG